MKQVHTVRFNQLTVLVGLTMEDLEAENKRLQRALDMRKLEMKQKELLKAKEKMERLRQKLNLQAAEADNKELRGAAKQVHS